VTQNSQSSLSGKAARHNQRLFSDYFLDHILPKEEPWQYDWHLAQIEAETVLQQLRDLFAQFTPNDKNEAQTEEDWIRPVLRLLGHTFEVQVPLHVPDGTQRPDYFFYRDENARLANKNKRVLTEDDLRQGAFAVGDAKAWELPLDRTTVSSSKSNDPFSNKNPSYQIFFYMLHSGLPWGILTNGRHWRLYHSLTAHKLDIFYEIDLPALLAANDGKTFVYFYAFFRRQAFEPGTLALERILSASTEFARGISESLRQQVYDALRYVAQGFLDYSRNKLPRTPETYKQIYDNSLILLYRLLFILYAEARDLLPLQGNRPYSRKYSLYAIKHDAVEDVQEGMVFPSTSAYWTRLKDLFRAINEGSEDLRITTFNGGLFDPKRHPFLEQYTVGDLHLCKAIEKLSRVNSQFVDYRDLAERHLGTIYEGLLEYTLQVATEPMVELRSTSKLVPAPGIAKKDIATIFRTGETYLVTDLGERKITGSYYTPDYIVKYMVDEAIRPALDAAVQLVEADEERVQAVLSLNILDPSMGSGHFPVEVTEYIARYLVELGVQPEAAGENIEKGEAELSYWKRRVAQQCIYGVDLNPLAVELAKLSLWLSTAAKDRPLSFLDHHLRPGNALIGSWLNEVASGQHPAAKQARQRARHVAEIVQSQQTQVVAQLTMLADAEFRDSMSSALASIAAIEQSQGITLSDVKAQEAAYAELRQRFSEKYSTLANLGAALYYDLPIGTDDWRPLADIALGKSNGQTPLPEFTNQLETANRLAATKRFFHWELEFPDIFFDANGQPLGTQAGFDVVIGNPPYVRQEQLSPDKPYYRTHYDAVYHGVADLFVYFFAQGLHLLREGGRLAYISSNMWLRTNYATPLRQYLRTQTTVETIVDLGNTRVFADAPDLSPSIQIVRKMRPEDKYVAQAAIFGRGERVTGFREQLADRLFALSIHDQLDTGWQMTGDAPRALFAKIMAVGKPLGEVVAGRMYYGIKTGLNAAFIIDQSTRDRLVKDDPSCASIIKPMLRGEDLRPWYQENEGRWLICLPNGWTVKTFPTIGTDETAAWQKLVVKHPGVATHLKPFEEAARKRQDKGQFWWELRPCDYYDQFEQSKIFWPDIAKYPRFSWNEQGQFVNNKGYILPATDISLLGILQSRLTWFCITKLCAPLGERLGLLIYQHFTQFMKNLPIPPLTDTQRETIAALSQQLTMVARQRYEVRRKTSHRIASDLGTAQGKLNQRLEAWWQLSFKEVRGELQKVYKRDIPLQDRDDWEGLLQQRSAEIGRLTDEIIKLETALNEQVYAAFELSNDEVGVIERETKYRYGEW